MSYLAIASCLLLIVYDSSLIDIMPELKRNILNFGYGVNFKYEGMLSHSFDQFYIVTNMNYQRQDLRHLNLTSNVVMLTILVPIVIMQNF